MSEHLTATLTPDPPVPHRSEKVNLVLRADNKTNTRLTCHKITIAIPVGDRPTDLTTTLEDLDVQTDSSSDTTWTRDDVKNGVALTNTTGVPPTGWVTATLTGITVGSATTTATVTVTDDTPALLTARDISTLNPRVVFSDLIPRVALVPQGTEAELIWQTNIDTCPVVRNATQVLQATPADDPSAAQPLDKTVHNARIRVFRDTAVTLTAHITDTAHVTDTATLGTYVLVEGPLLWAGNLTVADTTAVFGLTATHTWHPTSTTPTHGWRADTDGLVGIAAGPPKHVMRLSIGSPNTPTLYTTHFRGRHASIDSAAPRLTLPLARSNILTITAEPPAGSWVHLRWWPLGNGALTQTTTYAPQDPGDTTHTATPSPHPAPAHPGPHDRSHHERSTR
jgi:hypothetical protein